MEKDRFTFHWERMKYTQAVIYELQAKGISYKPNMYPTIETHFMNAEPVGTCVAFIARMND